MKEKSWLLKGDPFNYTASIVNDKLSLIRDDKKATFEFNKEDVLNVKNLSKIVGSNYITHVITINLLSIRIGCCVIPNSQYEEIVQEFNKNLLTQDKTKDMKFKVGDKVKIVKESQYYRDNDKGNPKDTNGEVFEIVISDSMPIKVRWSNNRTNCYYESDLELVQEIQEIQEMKKYKVLKDFDGKKVGNIVELPNTAIQWLDSNDFIVQTTLDDLISKEFIELYKEDYKNGAWVYFEKPNKSYGVFMYDGKVEDSVSAKNAVFYNKNSEISLVTETSQRWRNFAEVKRLATEDEVKKALIEIAKIKGFKKGTKFVSPENNKEYTCNGNFTNFHSLEGDYWLLCGGVGGEVYQIIYYKGVWAEIVKEEVIEIVGYNPVFNSDGTVSIGCNKNISVEVFKALKTIQDYCIKIGYNRYVQFKIDRDSINWDNDISIVPSKTNYDCTKGVHAVLKKLK
jgi:hypothetical protein